MFPRPTPPEFPSFKCNIETTRPACCARLFFFFFDKPLPRFVQLTPTPIVSSENSQPRYVRACPRSPMLTLPTHEPPLSLPLMFEMANAGVWMMLATFFVFFWGGLVRGFNFYSLDFFFFLRSCFPFSVSFLPGPRPTSRSLSFPLTLFLRAWR